MRPGQCLDADSTRTTAQVARIVYLDIHRVLEIVALQGVGLDAQIEIRTTVRDTEEVGKLVCHYAAPTKRLMSVGYPLVAAVSPPDRVSLL